MSLDTLKRSNSLDKLLNGKRGQRTSRKKSYVDERLWKPELDKSVMVTQSFVSYHHQRVRICLGKVWNHASQPNCQWYIENSLTTIGQKDPVSEYNSKLWNSGVESDKEIARKQKRNYNTFLTFLW